MESTGSPNKTANGLWSNICEQTFIKDDLTLVYHSSCWVILNHKNIIIAYACSFASHPLSTRSNEWIFIGYKYHKFKFQIHSNTCQTPYELEDIGEDYFMRVSSSTVIWWRDPNTDEIEHSGAKYKNDKSGNRCR